MKTPLLPLTLGMTAVGCLLAANAFAQTTTRSYDGSDNNTTNTLWGSAGSQFARIAAPAYDDGFSAPAGPTLPNPRTISNAVSAQSGPVFSSRPLTDFVWQWGQFIDHDITLAATGSEYLPIDVPGTSPPDPLWPSIPMNRTKYDLATGTTDARQQLNAQSSFLDGSMIYGADGARAAALRDPFEGGRLLMTLDGMLPTAGTVDPGGLFPNANDAHILSDADLFFAGDVRSNEQPGLTAMHTLFAREHNRLAAEIEAANPGMSDEDIFQKARSINIGQVQNITYSEFLPALMGSAAPGTSSIYDPLLNPSIKNEFAAAFFRVGHTMVSPQVMLVDNADVVVDVFNMSDIFFTAPEDLDDPTKVDFLLKGLASQVQQELDTLVIDDMRNALFGAPGMGGLDLASLNIQRGREHGLPDYNTLRTSFGLDALTDFSQITSDVDLAMTLQSLYADIGLIDPWVGALAEDHLPGSSMGELLTAALIDQFVSLRDGDRFFFTRDPNLASSEIDMIADRTLADIIRDNTTISNIQDNVFVIPEPSRILLFLLGSLTMIARRRRPAA